MNNGRIAIPSDGNGGIDSIRSQHFGHCDVFTIIDVENGQIKKESVIMNKEHGHGGCMVPVNLLAQQKVNAIVVGGIGRRPLVGFGEVGIDVYFDSVSLHVKTVVDNLIADKLEKISLDQACGGGGNCH